MHLACTNDLIDALSCGHTPDGKREAGSLSGPSGPEDTDLGFPGSVGLPRPLLTAVPLSHPPGKQKADSESHGVLTRPTGPLLHTQTPLRSRILQMAQQTCGCKDTTSFPGSRGLLP